MSSANSDESRENPRIQGNRHRLAGRPSTFIAWPGQALSSAQRVAIVGAGFIGLEVAASYGSSLLPPLTRQRTGLDARHEFHRQVFAVVEFLEFLKLGSLGRVRQTAVQINAKTK